jgi:hypothetical protein
MEKYGWGAFRARFLGALAEVGAAA